MKTFDVIVVGGGHAGIEAAYASARMGSNTALITLDPQKIGLMACNPSIGGVGKGHIVHELGALGGAMPQLCTKTYIQARMLNTRKGPAVQGLRLQIDKNAYNKASIAFLKNVSNLTIIAGAVTKVLLDSNSHVTGLLVDNDTQYGASNVILTTGTFLNGLVHVGKKHYSAGRHGEKAVSSLSLFLQSVGLKMGRLKTGTPPRLLRSSINFAKLTRQESDELEYLFEFYPHKVRNTHDCYITHTNKNTHQIVKENLHLSAMYGGIIEGTGPRYCPSIEDKIARFPDKDSHHVFVEPEGARSDEIYPSGLSTSLPIEIQKLYINSIEGFENAIITQPGYAVEYDFVLPDQLKATLEVKSIPGLFLAGQINGTTGYEEAAGQGIVAGINAHLRNRTHDSYVFDRNTSYIGVMIDDLTRGVDEPYRMFTSRAERRLYLRQDNSFLRLTDDAYRLGLIEESFYVDFKKESQIIHTTLEKLQLHYDHNQLLSMFGTPQCDKKKIQLYIKTPLSSRALDVICAELQYKPYLEREKKEIERSRQHQQLTLPPNINYASLSGISRELQEKLIRYKPKNIEQASLIPGMTPAAISLLIITIRKKRGIISK